MIDRTTIEAIWAAIWWDEPRDARDISDEAGVPRGRTCEIVRSVVRFLREKGLPVVSSVEGYEKTINPKKLSRCAMNLFARAAAMQERAGGILGMIETFNCTAQIEAHFESVLDEINEPGDEGQLEPAGAQQLEFDL